MLSFLDFVDKKHTDEITSLVVLNTNRRNYCFLKNPVRHGLYDLHETMEPCMWKNVVFSYTLHQAIADICIHEKSCVTIIVNQIHSFCLKNFIAKEHSYQTIFDSTMQDVLYTLPAGIIQKIVSLHWDTEQDLVKQHLRKKMAKYM